LHTSRSASGLYFETRAQRVGTSHERHIQQPNPTLPSLCFTTLRSGTIQVPADGFSPRLRIQCWAAAVLEWKLVDEIKAGREGREGSVRNSRRCLDGKGVSMGVCKTTGFPCRQENFWMPRRLESLLQSASHRAQPFELCFEANSRGVGEDNNNIRGR
jgi:hypothetical protein